MKDQPIIQDERTRSIENASYRLGFIIISFGLLLDVVFRSAFFQEAPWDLLALVIVGGFASTIYQGLHKSIRPNFWRSILILGLASAAVSALLVLVLVNFR